jgi:protein-disulfide isomerase
LPTTPVSLQFANTFPGGAAISGSGPPAAVKTLANSVPVSMGTTVQSIVQNFQQQQQAAAAAAAAVTTIQQVVHSKPAGQPNVSFTAPVALRPVSRDPVIATAVELGRA